MKTGTTQGGHDIYELRLINELFDLPDSVDLDNLFDSLKLAIATSRMAAAAIGEKPSALLEESMTYIDDGVVSGESRDHFGHGIKATLMKDGEEEAIAQ